MALLENALAHFFIYSAMEVGLADFLPLFLTLTSGVTTVKHCYQLLSLRSHACEWAGHRKYSIEYDGRPKTLLVSYGPKFDHI